MPSGYRVIPSPFVNVREYGAVGDGVADDYLAFVAAFAACPAGGIVYIPPGYTYLLGTGNLAPASGTKIMGGGAASIVKVKSTLASQFLFILSSKNDVEFAGFAIDGNRANVAATVDLIVTTGAAVRTHVHDMHIYNAKQHGVFLYNTAAGGKARIHDNLIHDCGGDGILVAGNGAYEHADTVLANNTVYGCNILNLPAGGGGNIMAYQVDGLIVSGNMAKSCAGTPDNSAGIHLRDCKKAIINGNNCDLSASQGILAYLCPGVHIENNQANSCTKAGVFAEDCLNAHVNHNACNSNGWAGITLADSGTGGLVFCHGSEAIGNTCNTNYECGISCDSNFCRIANNHCKNNGQLGSGLYRDGIKHYGQKGIVAHNHCYDDQGSPTQVWGISEFVTSGTFGDFNQIYENYTAGNLTANIKRGATNSKIRDNIGYVTRNYGRATVAHGGTIAHGLAEAPTSVQLTARIDHRTICDSFTDATNIFVGLVNRADGATIAVAEAVDWQAEV